MKYVICFSLFSPCRRSKKWDIKVCRKVVHDFLFKVLQKVKKAVQPLPASCCTSGQASPMIFSTHTPVLDDVLTPGPSALTQSFPVAFLLPVNPVALLLRPAEFQETCKDKLAGCGHQRAKRVTTGLRRAHRLFQPLFPQVHRGGETQVCLAGALALGCNCSCRLRSVRLRIQLRCVRPENWAAAN